MAVQNVYLREIATRSFAKHFNYSPQVLETVAEDTLDLIHNRSAASKVRILDIGIGTGAFTLPFLEGLYRQGINFELDSFDLSDYMLNVLRERVNDYRDLKAKINFFRHDAEEGLQVLQGRVYDIVIVTFVLHYLKNWRELIRQIYSIMNERGILLQTEVIGDMRNVDGKFDVKSPYRFEQFWKYYFYLRGKYSPWSPQISVTDLGEVINYMKKNSLFKDFHVKQYYWETETTFEDMILWIRAASVSSLGAGLSDEQRNDIANSMEAWLTKRHWDIKSSIRIRWGLKVIWAQKAIQEKHGRS